MKLYSKPLLPIAFLLGLAYAANAQNKNADALLVKQTTDFNVTGNGSSPAWQTTDWIDLGKRKGLSEYRTRAKLLYSPTGIYALFSCQDKKITATFKEDFANLWTEDVVEIFLWPDESESLYFEYELSPLNYELAILVPNMDGTFLGWRPWQYEGERKVKHATEVVKDNAGSAQEWIGEFFIPFALLKPLRNVPPRSGDVWRMNMYRVDYDKEYTSWSWKPVQTNFHDFKSFGKIKFE